MATFIVSKELQALISGFGSRATANITIENSSSTTIVDTYPSNPDGVRRSLVYDSLSVGQYNVRISNFDGSSPFDVTVPR
jgi:hypothetical protein